MKIFIHVTSGTGQVSNRAPVEYESRELTCRSVCSGLHLQGGDVCHKWKSFQEKIVLKKTVNCSIRIIEDSEIAAALSWRSMLREFISYLEIIIT